jgi:hypothetical protein
MSLRSPLPNSPKHLVFRAGGGPGGQRFRLQSQIQRDEQRDGEVCSLHVDNEFLLKNVSAGRKFCPHVCGRRPQTENTIFRRQIVSANAIALSAARGCVPQHSFHWTAQRNRKLLKTKIACRDGVWEDRHLKWGAGLSHKPDMLLFCGGSATGRLFPPPPL